MGTEGVSGEAVVQSLVVAQIHYKARKAEAIWRYNALLIITQLFQKLWLLEMTTRFHDVHIMGVSLGHKQHCNTM